MTYRNGEQVETDTMDELEAPVFYVIQLPFAIKVGQSMNALRRWQQYYRTYDGEFKVLHLTKFRRASQGYSYRETDTYVPRQDWSAKFERDVIAKLKELEVKPFYTGDPVSSIEYYRLADKRKILKAVDEAKKDNERSGDPGKATRNRQGNRKRNQLLTYV